LHTQTVKLKTMKLNQLVSPFCWRQAALAAVLVLGASVAQAQWIWMDASGKKVFSDLGPPSDIPEKNILKRPGVRPDIKHGPTDTPVQATAPASPVAPAAAGGKDAQLEARKKQAEKLADETAQAKKKADAERIALARAENCDRARRAKATMDSGVRIATSNARGEREILDDKARASEVRRLEEIIRLDCSPLPTPAVAPVGGGARPVTP
jgi:hypothetical protein